MKINKFLPFKFKSILSISLKTLFLFIGLNIILTTIFVLIKDQIKENYQKETSCLSLIDI
tara:strand:+ start:282 stop:461 length:180 start_codon:yes stop_codon:yes gene_type:complete